jgi:hypothetical protein
LDSVFAAVQHSTVIPQMGTCSSGNSNMPYATSMCGSFMLPVTDTKIARNQIVSEQNQKMMKQAASDSHCGIAESCW